MTFSQFKPMILPLILLGLIGCQSTAPRTAVLETEDALLLGYNPRWATTVPLKPRHHIEHARLLDDTIILVEFPSNLVTAINFADGSLRWRHVVGHPSEGLFAPVRHNDNILINSQSHVYTLAVDTGLLISATKLESLVSAPPALVGDFAIFGGLNHKVFAHDVVAGYTKWSYLMTNRFLTPPIALNQNVFAADGNGVYAMFKGETGQLLWKSRAFGRVSAAPATSPVGIFVASNDRALYALNPANGKDRWVYRATHPLSQDPKLVGNTILLPVTDNKQVALDARTGTHLWEQDSSAKPVAVHGDYLLFNHTDHVKLTDPSTGDTHTQAPVAPLFDVLVGPKNQLIMVSQQARLLRLDPTP